MLPADSLRGVSSSGECGGVWILTLFSFLPILKGAVYTSLVPITLLSYAVAQHIQGALSTRCSSACSFSAGGALRRNGLPDIAVVRRPTWATHWTFR